MKLTSEELSELLRKEYQRGFADGRESVQPTIYVPYRKTTLPDTDLTEDGAYKRYTIPSEMPLECGDCPMHPRNGGSGNCNCTRGAFTITAER